MIKNLKIRILAFFMAVTLSFCVCSNEYCEVKALEWVAPVVGLDTALKALLGLLGVTASAGLATQIDWSDVRDDAVNYQIQKGNDAVAVGRWWDKVISGSLDTASSCWSSFKEWVNNELLSDSVSNDSNSVNGGVFSVSGNQYTISDFTSYYNNYLVGNISFTGYYTSRTSFISLNEKYYARYFIISSELESDVSATLNNINHRSFNYNGKTVYYITSYGNSSFEFSPFISDFLVNSNDTSSSNTDLSGLIAWLSVYGGISIPMDNEFESAFSDIGSIALAPDVATDLPYDGEIDIPWENVGATDTAIDDAFDDAIDKVNTGTWTLDQYWTWVQNITNVFAYDTTNNYLLPNDGDDEKADDKVQQNINRGAMVLYGLEKVFPFCIPWDIYAFVNLLVADPVAPVIEYPIYNPVSGEDETIIIDFSVWESQVILMRYIQDFLLIIGLLLLARSLIGAGGSD